MALLFLYTSIDLAPSSPETTYYQSTIPVSQKVYWKVKAIDSTFKSSNYCAEQIAEQTQATNGSGEASVAEVSGISFQKSHIRVLPNLIRSGDERKTTIYLGGLSDTGGDYRVIISTVSGDLVKDLGTFTYSQMNQGIEYNLLNKDNKKIGTGIYIIFITGPTGKFYKKLHIN